MSGPHYHGGHARDLRRMSEAVADLRDAGGLPGEAALVFSQLLLNLAGHAGRAKADQLISAFLEAADVGTPATAGVGILEVRSFPMAEDATEYEMRVFFNTQLQLEWGIMAALEAALTQGGNFERARAAILQLLAALGGGERATRRIVNDRRGGQG